MSPEQARGKSIHRQADIWSFGVVLFEMLTAEKLFGGEAVFGPLPLAPDGKRFLANRTMPGTDLHHGIRVVFGWADRLEDIGR